MFRIQVDNLKFKLSNAADPLFVISHLVVKPGEKLAIIGPNETGKTSFLKALISKTESSQIKIHRTIAYVAQGEGFTSESSGEKVKCEPNEAFDQHPDILLLDEPTANLDQENQNWLINQITHSRASILIVSHDQFLPANNFSWQL
ncbi:AAA family ATPase [Oenococcus oeni]